MPDGTQIDQDVRTVLSFLAEYSEADDDPNRGRYELSGDELQQGTTLPPHRLNDAVELLANNGYVELLRYLGTAPFTFGHALLTPLGRYEYQRLLAKAEARESTIDRAVLEQAIRRSPIPVGSPYGFTEQDWEVVEEEKSQADKLVVVFGYQFDSGTFDSEQLTNNLGNHFQSAIETYNRQPGHIQVTLDFRPLSAGLGEHLFNEIARDIIASDIAIFETSDLNPNVMIEMGVALTWGTRVLPIKAEGKEKPPSDISGQTWVDYRNSGEEFLGPDFQQRLIRMIDRALRRKSTSIS